MIQEIGAGRFHNEYQNRIPQPQDYVIAFEGRDRRTDRILAYWSDEDNTLSFPRVEDMGQPLSDYIYLFSLDGCAYYLLEQFVEAGVLPEDARAEYRGIRSLRVSMPQDLCFLGMTAYHLFVWYRNNRFCGKCGNRNIHDDKERMMRCPSCGQMHFPKICPAVIVAVRDGERLMMSRYAGREYKGRALLAGFCEIGETAEETVSREVMEEVGIRVKNIRYFGSQPWGFDRNLLLGFVCDLDGDDTVTIDTDELAVARWVSRDEIEPEKNLRSLTATMIEAFRLGEI